MSGTVFVTGAAGFVGSRFAASCAKKGIPVKALVRDVDKARAKLKKQGLTQEQQGKIHFIKGNLLDQASYEKELAGCEAVYHAAAKVGYLGSRREYLRTNYWASIALAEAAKQAGVERFVYLSSQAAVRPIRWRPGDSQENLGPDTPYPSKWQMGLYHYGWAKQMAEKGLLDLSDISFAVTIFRPHVIWGIGDTTLANVLSEMGRKGSLVLVNGPHRCASSHIETVLHYSHRALEIEKGITGIFHVLDSSRLTMNQWLDSYAKVLGLPKPKRIPYHAAYVLASLIEGLARIVALFKPGVTPPLDRFVVDGMGRAMDGEMKTTIEVFGAQPEIDVENEMDKFGIWYKKG